ncbi:MAG: sodium/glutamate symporter [Coriobacteriia bacterium]|nr:sodium/glutamate symporter [Coriobacteriia bacterium]
MSFATIDGIFTISCDMTQTLAVAAVVLLIGMFIRKHCKFLRKYCIPAPVVGGFLFMIAVFIGHVTKVFSVEFDVTFQSIFMVAFFTTVGLGADFKLLKKGGKLLIIYWICAAVISVIQGPLALGIGNAVGMDPAYSITAGAISMSGGHGAATAYGSTLVGMGYPNAQAAGLAAATFGLICSVLIGGPLARRLIVKNHLESEDDYEMLTDTVKFKEKLKKISGEQATKNFAAIVICMALGIQVSGLLSALIGMTLPDYLGAMLVSVIFRNLNEVFHWYKYSPAMCDQVGEVCLDIFLSIAMMSIKLWQLLGLVGGLALIVVCQVVLMALYSYFIVFRALGKSFDAAVMCAGLCGHGLGATPTAMANMEAVQSEYGTSHQAFVIVPIVGGFLCDLIYQPVTILLINLFIPVIG